MKLLRTANLLFVLAAVPLLTLAACTSDEPPSGGHVGASASDPGGVVEAEHAVRCGCAVEDIGHCGNYIDIEGRWLPIGGEAELGEMEFCGRGELQARVTGVASDGVFLASSFELLE